MKAKRLKEISERAHQEHRQWGDPRKVKRITRRMADALYVAYNLGEYHGERGVNRNPYPAGRRQAEYERGFMLSDPMGDYHRNDV